MTPVRAGLATRTVALAVTNGVLYVGDTSGFLYVIDARTGASLKTISTGRIITELAPVVVNGVVYIGSSLFFPELDGKLHAYGPRQ